MRSLHLARRANPHVFSRIQPGRGQKTGSATERRGSGETGLDYPGLPLQRDDGGPDREGKWAAVAPLGLCPNTGTLDRRGAGYRQAPATTGVRTRGESELAGPGGGKRTTVAYHACWSGPL